MATKITKVQKYTDIIAMLEGREAALIDRTTAIEFINNEIALLTKKNTSGSKKETATQKENAVFMERIKAELAKADENGMKCSEIYRAVEGLSAFNLPKTTALVSKLVKAGEVVRTERKGVAYFSLA